MFAYIVGEHVRYTPPGGDVVCDQLNFAFGREKVGLVGKNGIGKTTLLRLLSGEYAPDAGHISRNYGSLYYLPQHPHPLPQETVAQTMGIDPNEPISSGHLEAIRTMGLDNLELARLASEMSAGQYMKARCVAMFTSGADILMCDEPTNNMDKGGKQGFVQMLGMWRGAAIIVTHDIDILNAVDVIIELDARGLTRYPGTYDVYRASKETELARASDNLRVAQHRVQQQKDRAIKTLERQTRRMNTGKRHAQQGGAPSIVLGAMRERAQVSSGASRRAHEKKLQTAHNAVVDARNAMPNDSYFEIDLRKTSIPQGKLVLRWTDIRYAYTEGTQVLRGLSGEMRGGERVALQGDNGTGKTTLVQILAGILSPQSGTVQQGVEHVVYLDQGLRVLGTHGPLLDVVAKHTGMDRGAVHLWLAKFMFYGDDVNTDVSVLSGGQRVRAALSCVFAGDNPPQLLILDEPTNNLDFESRSQLVAILHQYHGAMIVVSHDDRFLEHIGISRTITLT